jgi:predicted RNA binding protein with dsRBD fold (UPF0201 family)
MKKAYLKVLQKITDNIPLELVNQLMKVEDLTPTMREVFEKGVKDKDVRPELKKQMQAMLNSGALSRKVEVVDPDV